MADRPNRIDVPAKLLAAGAREFRAHGYGGAGVDGVAKAAGLTSGAFYAQFGSKAGAFERVVADGFKPLVEAIERFQAEHKRQWLEPFVDFYLFELGRVDLCDACVLPTLAADVSRAPLTTRQAYALGCAEVVDAIAAGFRGPKAADRAAAVVALLTGASLLARALPDDELRNLILAAARQSAIAP